MARQYQDSADEYMRETRLKDAAIALTVGFVVGFAVFLLFSRECLHIATPEEVAGRAYEKCLEHGGLNWGHLQWYLGTGQLIAGGITWFFLRRRRLREVEDEKPLAFYG